MRYLQGKRLLLLGSNIWKDDIEKFAKRNGVVLIFAGLYPGVLDEIADEIYRIDTTDASVMIPFIKEHNIDGIFMGGSEFIISKTCDYINKLGYPCYCTKNQWDIFQDKRQLKEICKRFSVPIVPEYHSSEEVKKDDFPVIVKPTDACASRGISICKNFHELQEAVTKAKAVSPSGQILIEKFVVNGGTTNMVKYVAVDGDYYLEAMGDRYVLDGGLITAFTIYPSSYLDYWIRVVDSKIRQMLKGIDFKNGVIAFQTIPDGDKVYIYECCLRITGGMTYKMTSATSGNNSLEMLLSHALTGKMGDEEDLKKIDPHFKGMYGSSLALPLRTGRIAEVDGIDEVMALPEVVDFTIYYKVGDEMTTNKLNTLDQLFARVMVVGTSKSDLFMKLKNIRNMLSVKDAEEKDMILWSTFDRISSEMGY